MINRIITIFLFIWVFCSNIYAQTAIELFDGASITIPSNSNGTKYVNFTVKNVNFSDSTSNECKLDYDIVISSVGQKTKIGQFENPFHTQDYFFGYREENSNVISRFIDNVEIGKNDSIINHQSTKLYHNDHRKKIIYYKNNPLFLIPHYDGSVYAEKVRLENEKIYRENKARQDSIFNAMAESSMRKPDVRLNLLPKNMINYIGKINRMQFEEIVGSPVGYEDDFIVYEVINEYDEEETALRCFFRETDDKLISIKFGTPHYLGYWIDFTKLKGYPQTEATAKKKGLYSTKRDMFGRIYQVNLKLFQFGCQIMDIQEYQNSSTAIINYHTVNVK